MAGRTFACQTRMASTDNGSFWRSEEGSSATGGLEKFPPKKVINDIVGETTPSTNLRPKGERTGPPNYDASFPHRSGDTPPKEAQAQGSGLAAVRSVNQMGGSLRPGSESPVNAMSEREQLMASRSSFEDSLSLGTSMERTARGEAAFDAARGRSADVDVLGNDRDKPVSDGVGVSE